MNIAEVRRLNAAAGNHFFDADTMRFFASRVLPYTWSAPGSHLTFFVTSERFEGEYPLVDGPRLYTVRVFNLVTGDVNTHGPFQGYDTPEAAFNAARDASLELP